MKKIAIMLMAAVAAFACTKPVTPSITGPEAVLITKAGSEGEVTFKVTANVPWTATVKAEEGWANITPKSGEAGETEIKVLAEAFEAEDIRIATVTLTGEGVVTEVALVQAGTPVIQVDAEAFDFSSDAASDELVISCNTSVTAFDFSSDAASDELVISCNTSVTVAVDKDAQEWLEVTPLLTKSLAELTYKVSVKENTVYAVHGGARYGEITITGEGVEEAVVVAVYQDGVSTSYFDGTLSSVVTLAPTVNVEGADYGTTCSIAILGDNLIVCGGDGSAPTILDKKTGENKGKLSIGDVKCFSVANDDAGHLLISNRVSYVNWAYSTAWKVYYMASTTDTPHELINATKLPYGCVGATITCRGDVTAEALIGAPTEFPGVTACNGITVATIKGGKVDGDLVNINVTGHPGLSWAEGCWNTAPNNFPACAFKSAKAADGGLVGWYDNNYLWNVPAVGDATLNESYAPAGWAANLCAADIRGGWVAYIGGQFFPEWALTPEVYVYGPDGTSYDIPTTSNGEVQICTTADVAIEVVEGGANVFYCDYNCDIIEGMFIPAIVK